MNLHANARTCPNSRALIARRVLDEGWSLRSAAEAAGVSEPTARKWVRRAAAGESLGDRSSAPARIPHRTPRPLVEAIRILRRLRMTAAEIAELLDMALSTVSLWLKRIGLGKRSRLDPIEPPNRYERRHAGELVHVDVKKLGRILRPGHRVTGDRSSRKLKRFGHQVLGVAGWEFVHVMVDDHSRLAYVEVLADERGATAAGFRGAGSDGSPNAASRSSGCSQTTAPATARTGTPMPVASSACVRCSRVLTGRGPTTRPSASSRGSSTSGPTRRCSEPQRSAPRPIGGSVPPIG